MIQFDEHIFQMGWLVQPPTTFGPQVSMKFMKVSKHPPQEKNMGKLKKSLKMKEKVVGSHGW